MNGVAIAPDRRTADFRAVSPEQLSRVLVPAAIAIGFALRCWQFYSNPALWLDEMAVVRNILGRSITGLLLSPLSYQQSAPKGFLLAEKLMTYAFGASDWALRIFPFVCSLAALVGFWRLVSRVLDRGAGAVALMLFAIAAPLIRFNSQVKPYAVDVGVAVFLMWLAVLDKQTIERRWRTIGVGGMLAVWFSQPAVFVVAAACVNTVFSILIGSDDRIQARRFSPIAAMWMLGAIAAALAGIASMSPATQAYMHRYWQAGFLPYSLSQELRAAWPWTQLVEFYGQGGPGMSAALGYPLPTLFVVGSIVGVVLLATQHWAGRIVAFPLGLTLIAAGLHQYPFSDRLILFLFPSLCLGIAAFIQFTTHRLGSSGTAFVAVSALVLGLAASPVARTPPPYRTENIKPLLAQLQAERSAHDGVYIYYGGAAAFEFYAPAYGLHLEEYSIGGCYRGESRQYLRELDAYRGWPRVWILFAHAIPQYAERDDIVGYLDALGTRREQIVEWPRTATGQSVPTELFLYDLSNAKQSATSTAGAFVLRGRANRDARLGCTEGPQAIGIARPPRTPPR